MNSASFRFARALAHRRRRTGRPPGPRRAVDATFLRWGTDRLRWLLPALGVALLLFVWLAVVNRIGQERAVILDGAVRETQSLAAAFEQRTLRTLRDADLTARLVKYLYERHGSVDITNALAQGLIRPDAYLVVSLADARGRVLASSDPNAVGIDIADREYFRRHAARDSALLEVSGPVPLRVSGRTAVQLTRRLNRPDGAFAGIVLLGADPAQFVDFPRDDLGAQGTLGLVGVDGVYRALIGSGTAAPMPIDAATPAALKVSAGTYEGASAPDGATRIVAYRRLDGFPLVVVVARAKTEILAAFERRRMRYLGVASAASGLFGLCFVVVTALAWQLKRSQRRAWAHARELRLVSKVFETTADGIMLTDADDRILRVNAAFTRLTGYEPADVVGKVLAESPFAPVDTVEAHARMAYLQAHGYVTGEVTRQRKDGALLALWITATCAHGDDGSITNYIRVFTDISALKATQRELEYLAGADMLTGLPNRRTFHERMHQLVQNARRRGARFGLMYVDLDGFKQVNDRHGHEAGDRLLQRTADLLRASVRAGDTAFRVGGDEFTVLLENIADSQSAITVAERIISGVEAAFGAGGEPADIGASIGIALYPDGGDDVPALLRNADAAMYRAKSGGRNGYRMYTAASAANAPDDMPQLADVA